MPPVVHKLGAVTSGVVRLLPQAPPGPADQDGRASSHKLLMLAQWDCDIQVHLFSFADLAVTSRPGAAQVSELPGQEVLTALALHNGDLVLGRLSVPRAPGSMPAEVDILTLGLQGEGIDEGLQPQLEGLHRGAISSLDIQASSKAILTVGLDGAICIVDAELGLQGVPKSMSRFKRRKHGCSAFTSGKWTGTTSIVTASALGGLTTWDTRMGPQPTSHSPLAWGPTGAGDVEGRRDQLTSLSGPPQVHSLAVHPSRPDLVACGGTGGAVGVWDLRWTTQPLLCALPEGGKEDVWEVRFDPKQSGVEVPGVLFCSQGGLLGLTGGKDSVTSLATSHHAVTSMDVDAQGGDLVAVTEGGELLYLRR